MADLSTRYPRIVIEFCTACKWNLRAAYVRPHSHFPNSCLPDISSRPGFGQGLMSFPAVSKCFRRGPIRQFFPVKQRAHDFPSHLIS